MRWGTTHTARLLHARERCHYCDAVLATDVRVETVRAGAEVDATRIYHLRCWPLARRAAAQAPPGEAAG